MDSNTSLPIVIIGVGGSVAYFFKGNIRFAGVLTMALGFGMLLVKRS
jgi:hypothetical protein